jgi:hypothetical protein
MIMLAQNGPECEGGHNGSACNVDGRHCAFWRNRLIQDVLIEKYIDAYLTTETVSVWHALEELGKAIRDEHAERREGASWSIAKEYVRSVLHRMT